MPPPFRWGLIGAAVAGGVGLFFSQFLPVFGGLFAQIDDPFGPFRLRCIPLHLFAFGLAGLAIGVGAYFVRDASARRG